MEGEREQTRDQTEGSGQQQPLGQQNQQQPQGQQQGQTATGQTQGADTDTLNQSDENVGPGGYSPESGVSDLGGGETGLGDSGSSNEGGFVGSQGQESGEYLQQGGTPQSGFAEQGRGASNDSDVERETSRSQESDSDVEGTSDNS